MHHRAIKYVNMTQREQGDWESSDKCGVEETE